MRLARPELTRIWSQLRLKGQNFMTLGYFPITMGLLLDEEHLCHWLCHLSRAPRSKDWLLT